MKKWSIAAGAILFVIFVAGLWFVKPVPLPRTTFQLIGQDGLLFKATIKADGTEVTFSGQLPMTLQVAGHSVDCWFQKMQPNGSIRLDVVAPDGSTRSVATSESHGGVRALIRESWAPMCFRKCMVTTF